MTNLSISIKSHFIRLYQMALSDGEFSVLEWELLFKLGESRGISRIQLEQILIGTTGVFTVPDSQQERIEYLYDMAQMVVADNHVDEDETAMLIKFARKFEFLEENLNDLVQYLIESAKSKKEVETLLKEING